MTKNLLRSKLIENRFNLLVEGSEENIQYEKEAILADDRTVHTIVLSNIVTTENTKEEVWCQTAVLMEKTQILLGVVPISEVLIEEKSLHLSYSLEKPCLSLRSHADQQATQRPDNMPVLSPFEIVKVAVSMIDVLIEIHKKNLRHGNIHSSVLYEVTNTSGQKSLHLTGFGTTIVKQCNLSLKAASTMAPELKAFFVHKDRSADIWSFGITLLNLSIGFQLKQLLVENRLKLFEGKYSIAKDFTAEQRKLWKHNVLGSNY